MTYAIIKDAIMRIILTVLILASVFLSSEVMAATYSFNENHTVIGGVEADMAENGDSLIEMARRYDLGYNAISEANPTLDPFVPGESADIVLPTAWILPDVGSFKGIVINISEMRLYFFHGEGPNRLVDTFPIGIGSEGAETPVGQFTIIQKITKPSWYPPESIRKERPELPKVVPPGPDNPLGSHALRLSIGTVLIHGTNRPFAVGRRASHGCIRMYPEDIPELFRMVSRGSRVEIIRQPVKVGVRDRKVYVEVHKDGNRDRTENAREAVRLLTKKGLLKDVNTEKLFHAVQEQLGMPVDITD